MNPTGLHALLQDPCNDILLADMALGDVLDAHSGLGRQGHRSVPHTIAQLLGERGVVEDADTSGIQESASSPRRSRSPGLSR